MSAALLDGKILSEKIEESLRERIEALKNKDCNPGLCVIMVGDDPASATYVRNKEKACERLGIRSIMHRLPAETTQEELLKLIDLMNGDDTVHGILVQLPLPDHFDETAVIGRIVPEKDVDGFHDISVGRLCKGGEGCVSCTPKGILYMLRESGIKLDGAHAVVIGRSNIVGKPMAMLLLRENATVTVCHSHTKNLAEITRQADILVAAVGKPCFVTAEMVKEGAAVVDVGINRVEGKLVGDVDFEAVSQKAAYISPVPGGVGKMTIAMLMSNTVEAAERSLR